MEKVKKEKVTISLNPDILVSSRKRAIDERTNLSALIERLLREYLSDKNE